MNIEILRAHPSTDDPDQSQYRARIRDANTEITWTTENVHNKADLEAMIEHTKAHLADAEIIDLT